MSEPNHSFGFLGQFDQLYLGFTLQLINAYVQLFHLYVWMVYTIKESSRQFYLQITVFFITSLDLFTINHYFTEHIRRKQTLVIE